MKRILLGFAVVVSTGCGSSPVSQWTVHPDGRIGPLRIDVSSEADVRKAAGPQDKVEKVVTRAHTLVYLRRDELTQ